MGHLSFMNKINFSAEDKKFLLSLARRNIFNILKTGESLRIDKSKIKKIFLEPGASFVTLTLEDKLRGCMGHLYPHQPLIDDILENSQNAAFYDPRFEPVRLDELEEIRIAISVLGTPEKIVWRDKEELFQKLETDKGVILKAGRNLATFLPEVWQELPDKEEFLFHLAHKAGLSFSECLSPKYVEYFIYSTISFKELNKDQNS